MAIFGKDNDLVVGLVLHPNDMQHVCHSYACVIWFCGESSVDCRDGAAAGFRVGTGEGTT